MGGTLAKSLLSKGYTVRIITRRKPAETLPKAEYAEADFADRESLRLALAGADAVVHLAAALFCSSKDEFYKANAEGTANLAAAAKAASVKKLVYMSSLAAAGPAGAEGPRTETQPEAPVSYYGKSKLAGEIAVKEFEGAFVIFRAPVVYGSKDPGISKIAEWVRRGVMVNAGAAGGKFSFVYVADLVRAITCALEEEKFNGGTFFVCEGRTYPWKDFIAMLAAGMGVKMPFMISLPAWAIYAVGWCYELAAALLGVTPVMNRDKSREASAPDWTCSPALWEKTAGWQDWTPLEEGIKKTFN